jgi:hypothetical protein
MEKPVNKFDPNRLPIAQIWTDRDLAKFALIAFVAGLIIGYIL